MVATGHLRDLLSRCLRIRIFGYCWMDLRWNCNREIRSHLQRKPFGKLNTFALSWIRQGGLSFLTRANQPGLFKSAYTQASSIFFPSEQAINSKSASVSDSLNSTIGANE